MFNGLLQTPVPIARMQFYGTLGGGVYQETLSTEPNDDHTNFGTNIGGGVKIRWPDRSGCGSTTGCSRCGAIPGRPTRSGSTPGSI